MRFSQKISVIDTHNAGEPMRIVTGGFPYLPGNTMIKKQAFFREEHDSLRKRVMHEPRGHSDMFGGVICEPTEEGAHLGAIFFDAGTYYHMCGHGAMALGRVAVEIGLVERREPVTDVVLDTSAGLVPLKVQVENGEVLSVTMDSNPSFLYQEGLILDLPVLGSIQCDLSFGGNFFALVDSSSLGEKICPKNAPFFLKWGMEIIHTINRTISISHPLSSHINEVTDLMFYETLGTYEGKNVVILGQGQFDRSPCGTGTASRVATLYHKGQLQIGERYTHRSIIDSTFTAWVKEETMIGDRKGAIISIKSRPFIIGFSEFVFSLEDPLDEGFLVERV